AHDLFGWMANRNFRDAVNRCLGRIRLHRLHHIVQMSLGALDPRLRLDVFAKVGRSDDGEHPELCVVAACKLNGKLRCSDRRRRAIECKQDLADRHVSLPVAAAPGFAMGLFPVSSSAGIRCRGKKNAFAIRVGTIALPMTAAIKNDYCAWSTMPCDKPNR